VESGATGHPGGMRRTTGAMSGLIITVLGAWGALIPFIGPWFDFSYSPDTAWHWSSGRLWLSVLPGVVAVIGGLMLMGAGARGSAGLGAWLALVAGVWFICGPIVSQLWNHGISQTGLPLHSNGVRVLEQLAFFYGIGAAITALAAFALGRLVPYRRAHPVGAAAEEGVVEREGTRTGAARRRGLLRRREPVAEGTTEPRRTG
jgi:hypothetical protein